MPQTAPPIDTPTLMENCMGNAALIGMLFTKFEAQARGDLVAIAEGIRGGDAGATCKTAHALKGAAGALAARGVQAVAARIESAARAGELAEAAACIEALQLEVDRCLAFLPDALAEIQGGKAEGGAGE